MAAPSDDGWFTLNQNVYHCKIVTMKATARSLTVITIIMFVSAVASGFSNSILRASRRTFSTTKFAMAGATGADIMASFSKPLVGNAIADAMTALACADAVCFDVDSTVIQEEGIDALAEFLGKGEAVAALTRNAMGGTMKFQDALRQRLELLEPSRDQILECLEKHPLQLTPGIEDLIETLHELKKDVYLVSGGFRIMIEPVAKAVCVSKTNIYANTILFDENGKYAGFDEAEPTSRDMGKPRALEMIQAKYGYKTMVMVGDGATDAQAKPPAKAFIGFGGIIVREAVKAKACWFVEDFADMQKVLKEFSTKV
jgi:phosphoserine phosphatase